ncbi:MAG: FG-GAP-like repeat-containing protein [Planctomycetota bacterium]|nr:FG-GAP-like repeat-containing protein [Planctomycetota bacterium]
MPQLSSSIFGFGVLTLGALTLGLPTPTATAQEVINYWVDTNGGDWNDPDNWSERFVPGGTDAAYLILGADYTIASEFTQVQDLFVDDGRVEIRSIDSGNFGVSNLLRIGNEPPADARLGLRGPGASFADTLVIGSLSGGEPEPGGELALGPARRLDVLSLIGFPHATLRFELDADSGTRWSGAQLTVFESGSYTGSIVIEPSDGRFPPVGTEIELLEGALSNPPELYLLTPPLGRTIEVTVQGGGGPSAPTSVSATVKEAETVTRLEVDQTFGFAQTPADLLVGDLNGDGARDIVVLRENGKNLILLRQTDGSFQPFFEFVSAPGTIAGTIGDFDGDGNRDVATASSDTLTGDLLQIFRNPDGDAELIPGPSADLGFTPVSISNLRLAAAVSQATGVAVTVRGGGGRGLTKAFRPTESDLSKTGEVEVGDDPGPSDPIDDETKKDEDDGGQAVGVGSDEGTGLVRRPVLRILRSVPDFDGGLAIERTVPLSGRAVDFVSGDVDADGQAETLVLTEGNRLEMLEFATNTTYRNSIPIPPGAIAISLGDLGADGFREVIIAYRYNATGGGLQVYRLRRVNGRPALERRQSIPIDEMGPANAVLVPGLDGRIVLGGSAKKSTGSVVIRRVEEIPFDPCDGFDLDGDGRVDSRDLGILLGQWGRCRSGCSADFDGDGVVGPVDLGLLVSGWGPC